MAVIAYALPIVPGQTESARNFEGELDAAGMRERYEELNRLAELQAHQEWVQSTPAGDLLVVVFETDAPHKLARPFSVDDPYDSWWRERVKRVHGFDPVEAGALPQLAYSWRP